MKRPPVVSPVASRNGLWTERADQLLQIAFKPVDISFLVLFRIVFSAAMLWTSWDFYSSGEIATEYIGPVFHFTYYGFAWVKPLAGDGMYVPFVALAVLAVLIGMGLFYRVCTVLLFVSFTYIFLLEKALYLNHYYLMCLLCFVQIFLPANRRLAIDSLLRPSLRTDFVPAWTLWILRFHIAMPYFLGGVAKFKHDWLCGQPMYSWLKIAPLRYLGGPIVEQHWVALLFSWGGAVFDLTIVPLLLWNRTRKLAFVLVVAFHLTNAFLFNIGVFPWLMIGASLVFFPADWARPLLRLKVLPGRKPELSKPCPIGISQKVVGTLVLLYVTAHLLVPFRHLLYPGNVLWTEEGQLFAWHMMLRTKVTGIEVIVTEPSNGRIEHPDIMKWLTPRQFDEMSHDPEMMREFAHFLHNQLSANGRRELEVHFLAISSLNGRKPQLLVDPAIDLARQPRTCLHKPWIVPLTEPFRWEPWNVPLSEWKQQPGLLRGTSGVTPGDVSR